jgi:hypothetical protein
MQWSGRCTKVFSNISADRIITYSRIMHIPFENIKNYWQQGRPQIYPAEINM